MQAYIHKTKKQTKLFEERRGLILGKFDDAKAMQYLEIKKKYQLL
jgi:hypothetical protein